MSGEYVHPVLNASDVRLLRRVYERIRGKGLLPISRERRNDFAGALLEMFRKGTTDEDALMALGVATARARFSAELQDARPITLSQCRVLIVEDDYHQASDLGRAFEQAGAIVMGPFRDEHETLVASKMSFQMLRSSI